MLLFPETIMVRGYRIVGYEESIGPILNNGAGRVSLTFLKNRAEELGQKAFTKDEERRIEEYVELMRHRMRDE